MELTLFGIKNCDTMKKAMKWLDDNGIVYHFHDYKKEGVPEQRLRQWLEALGWEKAITVATENPSIIKRPILQNDDFILAGFKADEWKDTLN